MKKMAAFWPAVLLVPVYLAWRAHSKIRETRQPVVPTRRNLRRPNLSTKSAVKQFPGNEAVVQRARRRMGR